MSYHFPSERYENRQARSRSPRTWGIVVRCEDGEVRHDEPFPDRLAAATFAEWGHCCTVRHSFERVTVTP